VLIEGRIQPDEYSGGLSMRAREIRSLEEARQARVSEVRLCVSSEQLDRGLRTLLKEALSSGRGGSCPVTLDYEQPRGRARIRLGESWRVHPSDELLERLRGTVGRDGVELVYER